MTRNANAWVATALLCWFATAAPAGELERGWWVNAGSNACRHCRSTMASPSAYDETTGRSLRNYPPDRDVDVLHMRLRMTIPEMNTPAFNATQRLTFRPLGRDAESLRIDAAGPMRIIAVRSEGRTCGMLRTGDQLTITVDPPVVLGETCDLEIDYEVTDPPEGIHWTPASDAWPGRPPQLHTQGEPESNRYWFPMLDFPSERLSTELIVTVPAGFRALSNGRLMSHDTGETTETFHWFQDRAHVGYLVTLVVGVFEVVDVGTRDLSMPVYVPPGTGSMVRQTYGRTARMITLFERLIDEPYPWDKYAQAVVWNFGFGGMENTSATTMYDTAVLDRRSLQDTDLDGLISHELAHQWFGDLITCRSWEHIWLNEGFATYFTRLWFEERDGADEYEWQMMQSFDSVVANDVGAAPSQPAMVSKVYDHPAEVFGREANPYPKGASVLHMLRRQLGDEMFFESIARYVDLHADQSTETDQLRHVFESVSGRSLQRFFEQWCERPGIPRLSVDVGWDGAASRLVIAFEQQQQIDSENPAFDITLPIWIDDGKRGRWVEITTDERRADLVVELPREPIAVVVDPEMTLLCDLQVRQSPEGWVRQAMKGPSFSAQVRALRSIESLDTEGLPDDAVRSAIGLVRRSREHYAIRMEAVDVVAAHGTFEELERLHRSRPSDARVRLRIVERLADRGTSDDAGVRERVLKLLRDAMRSDGSYAVRSGAVRGLPKAGGVEILPDLDDALTMDSQHDQIRRAVMDAVVELREPGGLELARRIARPGHNSFTRAAAVRSIGALSLYDPDAALEDLTRYVRSHEVRTAHASAEALAAMGDPEALAVLEEAWIDATGASARHALRAAYDRASQAEASDD